MQVEPIEPIEIASQEQGELLFYVLISTSESFENFWLYCTFLKPFTYLIIPHACLIHI